ncbi:MAG: hypothetical protein QOI48_3327 [Solirubrobacteraceae bacterium]|jgi:hypothetical protein|nr:hypothetical protein [Solirubrobacteraceae bacterium]
MTKRRRAVRLLFIVVMLRGWLAVRRLVVRLSCILVMLTGWSAVRGRPSRLMCACARSVIATLISQGADLAQMPLDRLIAAVAAAQQGAITWRQLVTIGVARGGYVPLRTTWHELDAESHALIARVAEALARPRRS